MKQQHLNQTNSKYEHVFAVIRVEDYPDVEQDEIEDVFTITKILRRQDDAEREVERLNNLNRDQSTKYFWQITRLERESMRNGEAELREALFGG